MMKVTGMNIVQTSETLPALAMGDVCEWVSMGRWSSHQLIKQLLTLTGPADVILATWAITQKPLETLERLKIDGQIKSLRGLFESKIAAYHAKSYAYAQGFFDETWLAKCHAKVTVITNETWQIAAVSSANCTINRRAECGVILCNPESAAFHEKWILSLKKNNDGLNTSN